MKKENGRIGLVIPLQLKEKIRVLAVKEHRNISNLIITVLYDYVERYEQEHGTIDLKEN